MVVVGVHWQVHLGFICEVITAHKDYVMALDLRAQYYFTDIWPVGGEMNAIIQWLIVWNEMPTVSWYAHSDHLQ